MSAEAETGVLPRQNPVILWFAWTAGLVCGWFGAVFEWRPRTHILTAFVCMSLWLLACALSGFGSRIAVGTVVFSSVFVSMPLVAGSYLARVVTSFWLIFLDALLFERDK